MNQRNVDVSDLFAQDAEKAKAIVDISVFKQFLTTYFYEKIGKFTLIEDVEFLGRCFAAIEAVRINYYDPRASFNFSAWTQEEQMTFAVNKYHAAQKKILFLNSKCREYLGDGFLKVKVDKSNIKDVIATVDAFAFVLENYEFILAETE